MKKLKISLLALSVVAGGSLVASAAPAPLTGAEYNADISFSNTTSIFTVLDTPLPDASLTSATVVPLSSTFVNTDGSGKIDGATALRFISGGISTNTNAAPTAAIADVVCSVTGNINLKGSTPQATIQIKGNGVSQDAAGVVGNASVSLKFVGVVSNLTDTGLVTIPGTFSGTIKFGLKSVNNNKPITVDKATTGSTDGVGFPISYSGTVFQVGTKFYTVGSLGTGGGPGGNNATGNGSVNSKAGTYSANVKGVGQAKGSSLTFKGSTSASTNVFITIGGGTNLIPVTISVPGSATANGKLIGQSVKNVAGGVVATSPFGP